MPDVERTTNAEQARRVRDMFAAIAGRYDLLNHLLSGNVDKRWRRQVAAALEETRSQREARILDVACGTGDLAFRLFEGGQARVIGVDFCRPMLQIATSKAGRQGADIPFIEGDALELPFVEGSFEAATIAFGLRNLTSLEAGFEELFRVLKPGGKLVVLEFSSPKTPVLRSIFRTYFNRVLPVLGGWISGSRSAYQYLPESVSRFPDQNEVCSLMLRVGFGEVSFRNLTGGIAALHQGTRPR